MDFTNFMGLIETYLIEYFGHAWWAFFPAILVMIGMFFIRLRCTYLYYVETGEWFHESNYNNSETFNIWTANLPIGFMHILFSGVFTVIALVFIAIMLQFPVVLVSIIIFVLSTWGFFYVCARGRNKKLFHDKLSGEDDGND